MRPGRLRDVHDTQLETLSGDECRRLLATESIGRLGVVRGGFPLILPVNYGLYRDRIVIHTDPGTKFAAARLRRVSFEVDRLDRAKRTGWSVLVQGFGMEVRPGDELYDGVAAVRVEPWAPGARDRILLVTPISVSGRRVSRARRSR